MTVFSMTMTAWGSVLAAPAAMPATMAEPAGWTLAILGAGAIGAALRGRRRGRRPIG